MSIRSSLLYCTSLLCAVLFVNVPLAAQSKGKLSIVRDTLDMGWVKIDECGVVVTDLLVKNSGDIILSLNAPVVIGADASYFHLLSPLASFSIPGHGSVNPQLRFCPKEYGYFSALIVFESDGGTDTVVLIGRSTSQGVLGRDTVNFGSMRLDSCGQRNLTITNPTVGTLQLDALIADENADFSGVPVLPTGAPIAAGEPSDLVFTFCAKRTGVTTSFYRLKTDSGDYEIFLTGEGAPPPPVPHIVWLDSIAAHAGQPTSLHLHVDPPLLKSDGVTGYRITLKFDPTSLSILRTRPSASLAPDASAILNRLSDSSVEIVATSTNGPLEGSLLLDLDLLGLSTGNAVNTLTLATIDLGTVSVAATMDGVVFLDGCSLRPLPKFSRRVAIESIRTDRIGGNIALRYHAPEGGVGVLRLVSLAGNEVHRTVLREGTGETEEVQVELSGIPPGFYIVELDVADDRSAAPIMVIE